MKGICSLTVAGGLEAFDNLVYGFCEGEFLSAWRVFRESGHD